MTIVGVVNIKGGVGKTTVAVNLAHAASCHGAPTLLWDLDPQGAASYALRVSAGVSGGLRGLLAGETSLGAASKGTDFPCLDLVPADFSARRLDVRLRHAGDGLAELLASLGDEYRHVVLDCPPGLSHLFESVAAGSDILLVPTPPTTFAVRALAMLMKHVRHLPAPRPTVLAVLSMVDPDSERHREFRQWAARQRWLFLETEVPLSPLIERLNVERAPVAAFAPASDEAALWARLWDELVARGAQTHPPRSGFGRSVKGLLARLDPAAAQLEPLPPAALISRRLNEIALVLRGEGDCSALAVLLGESGPRTVREVTQLEHVFDTAGGLLEAAGYALRLREADGRFVLIAKGPHAAAVEGALWSDRELEQLDLDSASAREILLNRRSPLDALRRTAGGAGSALALALTRCAGGEPLQRRGPLWTARRTLGTVELAAEGEEPLAVVLEFARTQLAQARSEYQLEVGVEPAQAERCTEALRRLFERAALPWRVAASKPAAVGQAEAQP